MKLGRYIPRVRMSHWWLQHLRVHRPLLNLFNFLSQLFEFIEYFKLGFIALGAVDKFGIVLTRFLMIMGKVFGDILNQGCLELELLFDLI